MVAAVNIRNLFSALVLSTLLIQCFGAAAEVKTNLTEHETLKKNDSTVKPAIVLLPSHGQAARVDANATERADGIKANATEHAAGVKANATTEHAVKPPTDAVHAEHGDLNKNVSSAKPVVRPDVKAKLSNGAPSSRASDGKGFDELDDDYDAIGHQDTIGKSTGDPGLPAFKSDDSSTTSIPATTTATREVSSTAAVPANTTSQEVSSTAAVPANTTSQEVSSTSSVSHSPKFVATTPEGSLTVDANSTAGDLSSTASPIKTEDGNGAASLTTTSSLILAACVGLLFI